MDANDAQRDPRLLGEERLRNWKNMCDAALSGDDDALDAMYNETTEFWPALLAHADAVADELDAARAEAQRLREVCQNWLKAETCLREMRGAVDAAERGRGPEVSGDAIDAAYQQKYRTEDVLLAALRENGENHAN